MHKYFLKSKFVCFSDEVEAFETVTDAIEHAAFKALPSEEFEVLNLAGIRVAGYIAADFSANIIDRRPVS